MASLEHKLAQNELDQKKGQFIRESQEQGVDPFQGNTQPTEYAKSAKKVVDKAFDPQTKEDRMLMSSIPRNILPNMVMLETIENGIEELYKGDVELWDNDNKTVTLYLNSDNQIDQTGDNPSGLIRYRKVTQKGYAEAHYWKNFWHGCTGSLLLMLPAVDGKSRGEAVQVVSAITNSDRALLEAQNNAQAGWFRRQYNKVFK